MLQSKYDKVMNLKIFVDSDDENLKNIYNEAVTKHNKKIQDYANLKNKNKNNR